jgi:hypothetical protein
VLQCNAPAAPPSSPPSPKPAGSTPPSGAAASAETATPDTGPANLSEPHPTKSTS